MKKFLQCLCAGIGLLFVFCASAHATTLEEYVATTATQNKSQIFDDEQMIPKDMYWLRKTKNDQDLKQSYEQRINKKLALLDSWIEKISGWVPEMGPYLSYIRDGLAYVIEYGIPVWLVYGSIISYVMFCFPLMLLAVRFGNSSIMAWIPILNLVLFLRIANRPWFQFFLFFIPVVNLIMMALVCIDIAHYLQKSEWIGILGAVPIVNIFLLWYFAFDNVMES